MDEGRRVGRPVEYEGGVHRGISSINSLLTVDYIYLVLRNISRYILYIKC